MFPIGLAVLARDHLSGRIAQQLRAGETSDSGVMARAKLNDSIEQS